MPLRADPGESSESCDPCADAYAFAFSEKGRRELKPYLQPVNSTLERYIL